MKNVIRQNQKIEGEFNYRFFKREKLLRIEIPLRGETIFDTKWKNINIEGDSLQQIIRNMKLENLGI